MGASAVSILTFQRVLQTLSILFCCYPFGESLCHILLLEGQTKLETSFFYIFSPILLCIPSFRPSQYEFWLIRLSQVTNQYVITVITVSRRKTYNCPSPISSSSVVTSKMITSLCLTTPHHLPAEEEIGPGVWSAENINLISIPLTTHIWPWNKNLFSSSFLCNDQLWWYL